VTFSLSGDGGDELFLGYPRYVFCQKLWALRTFGKLPWNAALGCLPASKGSHSLRRVARRARVLVGGWRQPSPQAHYRYWMDSYRGAAVPLRGYYAAHDFNDVAFDDNLITLSVADGLTYLPDDVMTKVDRASMANSLESRAPLLDHRIVEFAYALPREYKISGSVTKRVLREVLYRRVPREMVDRPKMGFSLPMSHWLKTDLRRWGEDLLFSESRDSDLFDREMLRTLWRDHLSGVADYTERLWGLLSLKSWLGAQC
jgi:asparagine synthase (glutamine-hydrolysing)